MAQPTIVQASPAQRALLAKAAKEFEEGLAPLRERVLSRLAWWRAVQSVAGPLDIDLRDVLGAEVIEKNQRADQGAEKFVLWSLALELGTAELVGIDEGKGFRVGVLPRGRLTPHMGLPPVVWLVVTAGAYLLTWLSIDSYADIRVHTELTKQADAANTGKRLELVGKAQAMGPDAMKQLDGLLDKIDAAAARQKDSIIANVSQAVQDMSAGIVQAVKSSGAGAGIGLGVALLIFLLFSRRRRA